MNLVSQLFVNSLLWFCVIFISTPLYARAESEVAKAQSLQVSVSEKEKFEHLVQAIYSRFQKLPEAEVDTNTGHAVFIQPCKTPEPDLYRAKSLREEAELLEKNWGVELRGRVTSESLQSGEDDDGSRGYIELSWNVLSHGFKENSDNAEVLYKRAELLELRERANKVIRTQRCIRYQLDKIFAGYVSQVLTLKLELLESIYPIEKRAYFKGWSQFDDLVVSDSELKLARHELNYLHSSPYFDQAVLEVQNPPDIDIDMEKLVLAIRENNYQQKHTELEKEILKQQKLAADDNQLRFFVRNNIIHDDSIEPSDVVVGMNFIIPFTRDSDQPLNTSIKALDEEEKMQVWERLVNVRDAYDKVRYQQKQLIKQKARFLRADERIRQTMAELDGSNHALLAVAATRLRTALDAGFELIKVKQELYYRINQVFLASGLQIKPEFIRLLDSSHEKNRTRVGERAIYMWSQAFNSFENQKVLGVLSAQGINEVLLSAGKKIELDKLNSFIDEAENRGVAVTMIVGANEWIFPEKHEDAAVRTAIAVEKTQRIHLDIEPHTLPGFKANREEYLQNYLKLIAGVRTSIGDRYLSVSVPVNWPEEIYAKLAEQVDRVNLMAYGSNRSDTIRRRISQLLPVIPVQKTVIALNMQDFQDSWAVEQMLQQLRSQTLIEKYAFHNFKTFLSFFREY